MLLCLLQRLFQTSCGLDGVTITFVYNFFVLRTCDKKIIIENTCMQNQLKHS